MPAAATTEAAAMSLAADLLVDLLPWSCLHKKGTCYNNRCRWQYVCRLHYEQATVSGTQASTNTECREFLSMETCCAREEMMAANSA